MASAFPARVRRAVSIGATVLLAGLFAGCSGGTGSSPVPSSAGSANALSGLRGQAPISPVSSSFQQDLASGRIRQVCPDVGPGVARCLSYVLTDTSRSPFAAGANPQVKGFGPADLQSAYAITSQAHNGGSGMTVAIVDAYSQPNIVGDLATYRSNFGLPACGTKNGCFRVVNQTGGKKLPQGNPGWGLEISLDVEMVSANCPNCKIILVEANSNNNKDLYIAVNEAVKLGANVVSNSWQSPEYKGELKDDKTYFSHPGVAIMASAGDSGYGVGYPSASNVITSVGGTALVKAQNQRGWSETVWNGTGGGCSAYEKTPAWQKPIEQSLGGCTKRIDSDLSYDADPNTGVAVYDTYPQGGWGIVGGTSVSSPAIAGVYALGGHLGGIPAKFAYAFASELNDVTGGSDGSCSTAYLCKGEAGFDAPTGNGTPNGAAGLDAF